MRIPLLPKYVSKLKFNGLLADAWGHWLKMKVLEFNYGMESETPDILGSTWQAVQPLCPQFPPLQNGTHHTAYFLGLLRMFRGRQSVYTALWPGLGAALRVNCHHH